jgi:hypothetical protein
VIANRASRDVTVRRWFSCASTRRHELLTEPNASRPKNSNEIALTISYIYDGCAMYIIKISTSSFRFRRSVRQHGLQRDSRKD